MMSKYHDFLLNWRDVPQLPRSGEIVHVISLGAGVQSSTMALMAAKGEITPMPKAAFFADTQAESEAVYNWLDWLEKQLPFPVYRVTAGNLTRTITTVKQKKDGSGFYVENSLPTYNKKPDGSTGHAPRQCTYTFKIEVLDKSTRRFANVKRGQKHVGVVHWIGISRDEVSRMKPSRHPSIEHRWPLVDMEMRRSDCLLWMERNGFPKPPRSACIYCPYHSNAEWLNLKQNFPKEFNEAVNVEKAYQEAKTFTSLRGIPFFHRSLKPLNQVSFGEEDDDDDDDDQFQNECEGMCGV